MSRSPREPRVTVHRPSSIHSQKSNHYKFLTRCIPVMNGSVEGNDRAQQKSSSPTLACTMGTIKNALISRHLNSPKGPGRAIFLLLLPLPPLHGRTTWNRRYRSARVPRAGRTSRRRLLDSSFYFSRVPALDHGILRGSFDERTFSLAGYSSARPLALALT